MFQNAIIIFLNNIRYLFRYNLKEMNKNQFNITDEKIVNLSEKIKYETCKDLPFIKIPCVKGNTDTLKALVNTNKSIIRFGDGEFMLMEHQDIPFQKYSYSLSQKLQEILKSEHENLLIAIPYEYYNSPKFLRPLVKEFMYTWVPKWFKKIEKYLNFNKCYYSTSLSQVYAMYETYDYLSHFRDIKKIWKDKNITVITGDRVLSKINHNVFESAKTVDYIYGPTKHAYQDIEILREKLSNINKNTNLVFAIGPAGKVLAYEMFLKGYRVLDIGHIIKDYDAFMSYKEMTNKNINDFFQPD